MASSYRFSATDLMALSGVPRAFEILDETLDEEVKAELESFAGNKLKREPEAMNNLRFHRRYVVMVPLHGWHLVCYAGYQMRTPGDYTAALRVPDDYPVIVVALEAQPGAAGREASVAAMKRIGLNEGWETYSTDDPRGWAGARRTRSLAVLLSEQDHIGAVKNFFIDSIQQLRAELTAFIKERPDLRGPGDEVLAGARRRGFAQHSTETERVCLRQTRGESIFHYKEPWVSREHRKKCSPTPQTTLLPIVDEPTANYPYGV